jgi:peptidyl-prolyl cis-trans isomerase B (cyclophilin B)
MFTQNKTSRVWLMTLLLILTLSMVLGACGQNNAGTEGSGGAAGTPSAGSNGGAASGGSDNGGAGNAVNNGSEERTVDTSAIPTEHPVAEIKMADGKQIFLELYPEKAPESVNNFIALANSGFYDGLTFHRIIQDFMIQGGDPQGTGIGGPGYGIKGEFTDNGVANDLSHTMGVISMARSQAMDSAGSQFFLMNTDNATFLDGQYAAFGKTIDEASNEAILAITATPLNGETPVDPPVIQEIRVDTRGVEYAPPTQLPEM